MNAQRETSATERARLSGLTEKPKREFDAPKTTKRGKNYARVPCNRRHELSWGWSGLVARCPPLNQNLFRASSVWLFVLAQSGDRLRPSRFNSLIWSGCLQGPSGSPSVCFRLLLGGNLGSGRVGCFEKRVPGLFVSFRLFRTDVRFQVRLLVLVR